MKLTRIVIIIILLCVIACIIKRGYREGFEKLYHFHNYWNEKIRENDKKYFKMLLDPLDIKKELYIHSVFTYLPYTGSFDKNDLHILWSGETYNEVKENMGEKSQNYDVKLIMEDTNLEKNTICHPLFIMDSYVYNYWPNYMTSRKWIPKKKFCAFVVSNENCPVRNRFFEKLNMYKKVDSIGKVLNNTGIYAPRNDEEKGDYSYYNFLSEYKFMICFENESKDNYLTEKLANAYLGKTIPIYWGASKARMWLNTESFLQLEEGATEYHMDRLINKIIEIDNNDALYDHIYKQPLMYKIHDELNIDTIRTKIKLLI